MTAFVTANNIPSGTAELTLDELNHVHGPGNQLSAGK